MPIVAEITNDYVFPVPLSKFNERSLQLLNPNSTLQFSQLSNHNPSTTISQERLEELKQHDQAAGDKKVRPAKISDFRLFIIPPNI
jgi:hypothetical protein